MAPSSSSSSKLIFLLFVVRIGIIAAQTICGTNGNFSSNTSYRSNLQSIFSSVSSDTEIDYGFYNLSTGQSPDRVSVVVLCRGDIASADCRSCVNDSYYHKLTQDCPYAKVATGLYERCMLRYSNSSDIFGNAPNRPILPYYNVNDVSNSTLPEFNEKLGNLMMDLRSRAMTGDGRKKSAMGEVNVSSFQNIYALAQCVPDLTQTQCASCLDQAIGQLPGFCGGKVGGGIAGPVCSIRYDTYLFYELNVTASPSPSRPTPPLVSPPPPAFRTGSKSNNTTRTVIIIAVSVLTLGLLIVFIVFSLRQRKLKRRGEIGEEIIGMESLQFDFCKIQVATDDFSDANKLGEGGFGAVYKGMLPDGQNIAVKRLSTNSEQGDVEFKNEVILVAKLQHRNLVRLFGFCLEGIERLLIYEYVPNASLDHFLFDRNNHARLDWERRYIIIRGIARGLLYLHEDSRLRIIHRDLKASNILLDEEMNPKISDFGMARLFVVDQTQGRTNRVVGTYGYMAPEYAMHGQFSVKSDVFSFGVLVLEIVTGQKNTCFRNGEDVEDLLSCAWVKWRDGTASTLVDCTLRQGSSGEIMRCIHIGLLCVQENVSDRPTMASVALMLNSNSLTLPVPSQPSFFMHSIVESETPLISDNHSANEVTITDVNPR